MENVKIRFSVIVGWKGGEINTNRVLVEKVK